MNPYEHNETLKEIIRNAMITTLMELEKISGAYMKWECEKCQVYLTYLDELDEVACQSAKLAPDLFDDELREMFSNQKATYETVRKQLIERMVEIELKDI
jgi:hypothetical protein